MDCLLNPRKIAVIGASEKVGPGRNTVYNLLHMDYKGRIDPVNPHRDRVFGLKCYPSLTNVPEKPDLAVIGLPAARVLDALRECVRLSVPAATVYTSGFAEVDDEGAELQREMTEICHAGKIRLCGPNCLGHLNVTFSTGAYSASLPVGMRPGKVAILSQSGSMAIAMVQFFKGLGLSHVISFGNQAVLEMPDYLAYLSDDPNTQIIAAFIEGVRDGRRFMESVRECRRKGKAVLALKVGASELGQKAISAHTAAIAGSNDVFREALRECGALQVGDLDEMFQTATLLLKSKKARSRGAMLVAISGGQVGLIADIAAGTGVEFPPFAEKTVEKLKPLVPPYLRVGNPLDVAGVGSDDYREYADILRACVEDPSAGMLLVSQDAPAGVGPSAIDHYGKIAKATAEVFRETPVPVVLFSNHSTPYCPEILQGMIDAGVPYLQGTRESLMAVSHFMDHSLDHSLNHSLEKAMPEPPRYSFPYSFPWDVIGAKMDELSRGKKFLGEREGKEIFSLLGIPVAQQIFCENEDEMLAAVEQIGYPLVMKIESPDIAHKTEVDGVALGLDSLEKVRAAREKMLKTVGERRPSARIEGITLQRMAEDGVDLIVGMHTDPQFGPVLVYGLGGIYVEVFKDASLGLIPINREKALEMVRSSKSYPLLKGVRGRAAMDEERVADVLLRLSAFVEHFAGRVSAIDINPLRLEFAKNAEICVLDALVLLESESR
ncbi:MAG: acetate--CoA ligase family protein [Synergistaceae bacterium]|nr:acetate--CoA ligase family protein [Synergistaceae bacterium]